MDPQSDITLNAAGTGPFKLDSLSPAVEVQLTRNPSYWRTDRPFLDGLSIRVLPDPSSALVNLEAGAVEMVQIRDSDVQQVRGKSGLAVFVAPGSGNYDVLLNTADPPFNDKRVRQAVDLALDRKRFSETVLYALADPTYVMWPKASPVWDASIDTGEFNLDKARQLLADAGYPHGFETKIQASNGYPEEVQFDQIFQADLASIGIRATIEVLEASQAAAILNQASFPALLSQVYGYTDSDPAMAFTAFPFRPTGNAGRFQSDEYIRFVDAARREPDPDKRLSLYRQIATFVKDEAFVLPLANYGSCYGTRSNVNGVARQAVTAVPAMEDVWLS
jgi:peptide/nickel transport system substrate-binding protein